MREIYILYTHWIIFDVLIANLDDRAQERSDLAWTPEHDGFKSLKMLSVNNTRRLQEIDDLKATLAKFLILAL